MAFLTMERLRQLVATHGNAFGLVGPFARFPICDRSAPLTLHPQLLWAGLVSNFGAGCGRRSPTVPCVERRLQALRLIVRDGDDSKASAEIGDRVSGVEVVDRRVRGVAESPVHNYLS